MTACKKQLFFTCRLMSFMGMVCLFLFCLFVIVDRKGHKQFIAI